MSDFDFDVSDTLPDGGTPRRFQKHPVTPGARIAGIIMVIAAVALFIYAFDGWNHELERMQSFALYSDPAYPFVNAEELTGNIGLAIGLMGLSAIMTILGGYRIIFSRKSSKLVFAAFFIVFAIAIGMALHVNNIRMEVKEDVLKNEKVWAEKRYGIAYDEITVKKIEPDTHSRNDYTIQDEVKKDGNVIATVCMDDDRSSLKFCEPGTQEELYVYSSYDTELNSSFEEDSSYPEPTNSYSSGTYSY